MAEPTVSQVPPDGVVTVAAALNVCADPSLADTITFCDGTVPPAVPVKLRLAEPRVSVGTLGGIGVVTLRVTGTASGLLVALAEVIDTVPW